MPVVPSGLFDGKSDFQRNLILVDFSIAEFPRIWPTSNQPRRRKVPAAFVIALSIAFEMLVLGRTDYLNHLVERILGILASPT